MQFYLAEIILGVEALHEAGILHRDLKPENVLMQSNGHLVITDFGCSIQSKEPGKAPTSRAFVGTDMYMAPEQVMKQEYSEAVDWYFHMQFVGTFNTAHELNQVGCWCFGMGDAHKQKPV
jgi:p70 ribosomal S6 kinase